MKKIAGSEETIFVYDAGGKLIGEYSSIVQTGSNAKTVYTTNDHLGSPRINTDGVGAVISRHDYHPFGEEIARTGYGSDTIRKQFTGYERDGETGLDFAQARYFGASLGRFTSPDDFRNATRPGSPASWNLYVYVLNNPLNLVDPTGTIERDPVTGEVIFTKTGNEKIYFKKKEKLRDANGKVVKFAVMKDGKEKMVTAYQTISWQADVGYVKADDGTKIAASKATTELTVEITDKNGNVFSEATAAFQDAYNSAGYTNTTDCHGNTFADGKVWIDNPEVEALMKGDGYRKLGRNETAQAGDVGIYSTDGTLAPTSVQHSVKVNDTGATSVESKGGITKLQPSISPGPGRGTAWSNEKAKFTIWTQRARPRS